MEEEADDVALSHCALVCKYMKKWITASYLSILFLGDQLCKQNFGEFGHI